jgi:hypothetical protein
MPELRQKNTLFNFVTAERNLKTIANAFKSLQTYIKYREQKRTTDHFMASAVKQVSAKRYFRFWRSKLDTRVGAKLLERTIDRALMRSFFTKVERKATFEDQALRHMSLFRCFKLLEFTFHLGLQRNVELTSLRTAAQ